MPLNSISFATDGMHWGTGDFAYLRNAVITATFAGIGTLYLAGLYGNLSLAGIWMVTGVWILVRSILGIIRIWPGIGKAPLREDIKR